ncbi:aminoacyl-tRNA hydrolase [Erysipelothrix sp. HDW6C]|uniref:aminoacyl-tRNA hydrolase n=1 Tax=Erysipelothrix sp. HDW6C TaxID=2714930 RepID=UPI001407A71B|nr:aminoacyl-tRNA hydrolase [Erysipelothrix sp. HDW6C]QIK69076.1 aminoacyl-tRNA hydrolase [Erysipelothrix sp. HDW6C]
MKIIVGLGNPGKQYEKTRHNAGFITIDKVAKALGVSVTTKKFKALIAETFVRGEKVILVKPQTYMNLSGESVREIVDYYDAYPEDIIVISDDKDLDVGILRIRTKGSSGGQNGIKSIINHLGTQEFTRIKVGIGKNPLINTADYVMGKIDEETAIDRAAQAILDIIEGKEVLELMNIYNVKEQ